MSGAWDEPCNAEDDSSAQRCDKKPTITARSVTGFCGSEAGRQTVPVGIFDYSPFKRDLMRHGARWYRSVR